VAGWVTKIQPTLKVSANQDQEVRFAVASGGAKTILPWANVVQNASSGTNPLIKLIGSPSQDYPPDGASGFWKDMGSTINVTVGSGTGAYVGSAISMPPPFLRWTVSQLTGNFTFELLLLCWDDSPALNSSMVAGTIGASAQNPFVLRRPSTYPLPQMQDLEAAQTRASNFIARAAGGGSGLGGSRGFTAIPWMTWSVIVDEPVGGEGGGYTTVATLDDMIPVPADF
jgi:hypothetical protein